MEGRTARDDHCRPPKSSELQRLNIARVGFGESTCGREGGRERREWRGRGERGEERKGGWERGKEGVGGKGQGAEGREGDLGPKRVRGYRVRDTKKGLKGSGNPEICANR